MKAKLVLTYLLLLSALFSSANNDKYRLILRDNPSTTIAVAWNQISGTNPILYYDTVDHGTNILNYSSTKTVDRSVSFKGMNNQFVRLTGLTPNTNYYFVIGDSEGTSQRFWFKTAPADNSRLSFIAGGDSRNNRVPRQNANLLVSKLKPHAILFGGDMTDDDTNSQWQDWFDDWQLTTASDGRMFPIIPARGNHEDNSNTIYDLFDTPNVNSYYAITFGNDLIRTYTLNSEISVLGDQRTWLENDLNASSSLTWKMAQYHKPMRPHTASKAENNSQYSAWANLFYDNNVRLVVDCDSHMAKTTWPVKPSFASGNDEGFVIDQQNGTVYTGEGCWGAPLRPNNDDKSWTRNSGSFNQFKIIFVEPSKIELRTIDVSNAAAVGEVSNNDPFTLPANLNIFSPPTGAVVTISNNVDTSCPAQGSPCDDGDSATVFDEEDGNCNCIGLDEEVAEDTIVVSASSDDAEERVSNGVVNTTSTDLELIYDSNNQIVGIRFDNVQMPSSAVLLRAYIQFQTDETDSDQDPTNLLIHGELATNSNTFTTSNDNISSRSLTNNSASWNNINIWGTVGEASYNQRTPYLTTIVNEIISQPGWQFGNAVTFVISGSGKRVAFSRDGSSSSAPKLILQYNPNCPISSIALGAQGACNEIDDTYSQDIILTYDNPPATGFVVVNGQSFAIEPSPQTVTLTGLNADGFEVDIDAYFSEEANCIISEENLFEAPTKCSFGGIPDNNPDSSINLALLPEAVLSGSADNGKGSLEEILYDPDPMIDDYRFKTNWNEYGVSTNENLGTPGVDDGFKWQVNWQNVKYINYLTFGGVYSNQSQPNTLWRISYRADGIWTILEEGQGGWIDSGIYEWGDANENPIEADALRVQLYSDGSNDLVSIHLRGRGGESNNINDSGTTPKATLIQYLSPGNSCGVNIPANAMLYCDGEWINGDGPTDTTGTKDILIGDGIYTILEDENVEVNDLEILTGATVIIKEGGSLLVNGDLINNGTLELESISDKYSSLIVEGTSTGDISYKRYVNGFNGTTGNDLIAAPVTDQTFGNFAMANPNLFENPSNNNQKLYGPFNEPAGSYQTYFITTDANVALERGIGYRAARDETEDGTNGNTLTFSGTVQTTGFTLPMTESVSSFSGWNLIGNPYPSYLDFDTFFNLNKDELDAGTYQAVYGYNAQTSNKWTILNNLSSGALIAPGQGFFVKTKSGGGLLNFTPEMRVKGNTDDFIANRNTNLGLVKVIIDNVSTTFETDIYFNANSSLGLDPGYDASLFGGSAPNFSVYTHLVEQNTGVPMAIQAVGEDDINDVIIPLGVHVPQGESISISLKEMSIASSINIYLEDRSENSFILLNDNDYSFTAEQNITEAGRFFIHFEVDVLSTTEEVLEGLSIFTDQRQRSIIIEGELQEGTVFTLYDINGRVITVDNLEASSTRHIINANQLNSGIYLLQIENGMDERRIQKIVLE